MKLKRNVRQRRLPLSLSCFFVVAGATCIAAAQPQPPVRSDAWQAVECSTFGLEDMPGNAECGYVTVPLRHARPNGPTIQLATVVIRSEDDSRKPDPLFIAQGGPGGSSIDTYARILATVADYNPAPNRDLVIWDQRGTLWSKPALVCPEIGAAELKASLEGAVDLSPEEELEPFRVCFERLAQEVVDFSAFNSVENAHDIEALRLALGYESINFYGVSYGTELGQYLMREHPEHLRAVILDAVVPMDFNLVTEVAFVKQRIGEKYFDSCAADPRCAEAFPDLGQRFLKLLDRLDAEPAIVEVRKQDDPFGEPYRIELDGESLEGILYQALYMDSLQPLIPYVVDRADHGDYNLLSSMLLPMVLFDDTFAEGMYMTVVCAERGGTDLKETAYPGVVERLAQEGREGAETILAVCREWGIELLDPETREPVESDIPTLLLSGDFDPITPPAFAARVGETLAYDFQVVFPKGTHGQAVSDPCANAIITSFLDDPEREPDAPCAATPPSVYTVPGDLIILPPLKEATRPRIKGISRVALGSGVMFLGLFVLSSAPLFYPIGWAVQRLRHRRTEVRKGGWGAALSGLAPWLAVVAFLVLAGFLLALGWALAADLASPALLFLGAVLSEFRWVFALALLFALVVTLMVVATVALWTGSHRSLAGRLYFSALTVTALGVVFTLWKMQLLTAFFSG